MQAQPNPEALPRPGKLTAEMRLEANRARIRRVMKPRVPNIRNDEGDAGELSELEVLKQVLEPAACEIVRRYPVRSLAGGAMVGAFLVIWRPWRGLLSSMLGVALVRQVSSASIQWMADHTASIVDESTRND